MQAFFNGKLLAACFGFQLRNQESYMKVLHSSKKLDSASMSTKTEQEVH